VAPELGAPFSVTQAFRGRPSPPGPTIVSRSGKPVRTTRSTPVRGSPAGGGASSDGSSGGSTGSGAVASAPITRGAAAPHRVWRDARAAETSGERLAIGRPVSNRCSISSIPKFGVTLEDPGPFRPLEEPHRARSGSDWLARRDLRHPRDHRRRSIRRNGPRDARIGCRGHLPRRPGPTERPRPRRDDPGGRRDGAHHPRGPDGPLSCGGRLPPALRRSGDLPSRLGRLAPQASRLDQGLDERRGTRLATPGGGVSNLGRPAVIVVVLVVGLATGVLTQLGQSVL